MNLATTSVASILLLGASMSATSAPMYYTFEGEITEISNDGQSQYDQHVDLEIGDTVQYTWLIDFDRLAYGIDYAEVSQLEDELIFAQQNRDTAAGQLGSVAGELDANQSHLNSEYFSLAVAETELAALLAHPDSPPEAIMAAEQTVNTLQMSIAALQGTVDSLRAQVAFAEGQLAFWEGENARVVSELEVAKNTPVEIPNTSDSLSFYSELASDEYLPNFVSPTAIESNIGSYSLEFDNGALFEGGQRQNSTLSFLTDSNYESALEALTNAVSFWGEENSALPES